jgi:hypothetical protein
VEMTDKLVSVLEHDPRLPEGLQAAPLLAA